MLIWLIHSSTGINPQKRIYERLCKTKMSEGHYTKLSKVCTQEHKQNAKILNMRNTVKEDLQKVQTEAGPQTDTASTQQHKKKLSRKRI